MEEVGVPTVYVGSVYDMMQQTKPPRPVFVNFPLGHQCGKPFDRELQMGIIKFALKTLETAQEPGRIIEAPFDWGQEFTYKVDKSELPSDQVPPGRKAAKNPG